jgi:hypothetical protein
MGPGYLPTGILWFVTLFGHGSLIVACLIMLSETYRWIGEIALLKEHREVAEKCQDWTDRYSDLELQTSELPPDHGQPVWHAREDVHAGNRS